MAATETNFHAGHDASVYAGASTATNAVFVGVRDEGAKVSVFMSIEQARKVAEQLTAAIAECDGYAEFKAKREAA